jgi:hypothetical protein
MATGTGQKALWGLELTTAGAANFGAGGTDINKNFGTALSIPTRDEDPLIEERYGPGSRAVQQFKRGLFKGPLSIEHDLITPFIMEPILGALVQSGSAGAYTFTISEADVHPTIEVDVAETLANGVFRFVQHLGTIIKNAELDVDASATEPLRLKLDCEYAKPMRSNAIPAAFTSAWAADTIAPPTFADAVWKIWNGSSYVALSNVDKMTLKIDQGTELRPAAGNNFPVRAKFGERHYDISCIHLFTDQSVFEDSLYGAVVSGTPAAPGTPNYVGDSTGAHGLQLVITLAGSPAPTYTFTFTQVIVTKHGDPVVGPKDEVLETVDMKAGTCQLVVTNWATAQPIRNH